jgi:hypothetical protein
MTVASHLVKKMQHKDVSLDMKHWEYFLKFVLNWLNYKMIL